MRRLIRFVATRRTRPDRPNRCAYPGEGRPPRPRVRGAAVAWVVPAGQEPGVPERLAVAFR